MMSLRPGRLAVVCALLAACSGAEPTTPPEPVPAPAPEVPAPPAPAVDPMLGHAVTQLGVDRWLQGDAEVGETQLVVFWELWCPHCRREVPRLQALHETLGPQGLEIVGLTRMSRGVTEEQLTRFAAESGLTYPLGIGTELASELQVRTIPSAVVLVDGEVQWQGNPSQLTEAQLQGWLDPS